MHLAEQMAKVGVALTEGRTGVSAAAPMDVQSNGGASAPPAVPREDSNAVRPQAFKTLIGRGNAEFQSNRQQVLHCRKHFHI